MNGRWGPKPRVEEDSRPSLGYRPFQSCLKNPVKKAAGRAPGKEPHFPDKETEVRGVKSCGPGHAGSGRPCPAHLSPLGGSPWQQRPPPPPPAPPALSREASRDARPAHITGPFNRRLQRGAAPDTGRVFTEHLSKGRERAPNKMGTVLTCP